MLRNATVLCVVGAADDDDDAADVKPASLSIRLCGLTSELHIHRTPHLSRLPYPYVHTSPIFQFDDVYFYVVRI